MAGVVVHRVTSRQERSQLRVGLRRASRASTPRGYFLVEVNIPPMGIHGKSRILEMELRRPIRPLAPKLLSIDSDCRVLSGAAIIGERIDEPVQLSTSV